jgi:FkbM family methyltransferase
MPRHRVKALLIVVAAVLFLLVALVYANASLTAKSFFQLEQTWALHWPIQSQQGAIVALEPALIKLRLLRPARVQVEPGISFFLDPRDLIPIDILRTGQWQPEIWSSIAPSLSDGSVFFDVGAHIGYFSMKASRKVGATGRVLSFEPNPETLKLLRDNVAANHTWNVLVEPIACTDRDQMLTLYAANIINTGASSLSSANATITAASPKPYSVRGRPIDDVVRELNLARVDVIKVDVEGAEVSVMRGALDTLRRFHPKVVIEVSPRQLASFQTTPADLIALFESAGYNRSRPLNPEEADWEWTLAKPGDLASSISVNNPAVATQFVRGLHPGNSAARWTDQHFTVALPAPQGSNKAGARLALKLFIASDSIKAFHEINLSAHVGSVELKPEKFQRDGAFEYRREVPPAALKEAVTEIDFSVDKFLKLNGIEYGILIMTVSLDPK